MEYEALLSNHTWDLVPCPPGSSVVIDKLIFEHKLHVGVETSLGPARCGSVK